MNNPSIINQTFSRRGIHRETITYYEELHERLQALKKKKLAELAKIKWFHLLRGPEKELLQHDLTLIDQCYDGEGNLFLSQVPGRFFTEMGYPQK